MKNNSTLTNQPEQCREIDYTVMGHDHETSKFLNKCLQNRDNLEFIFLCKTLDLVSTQAMLHFDHLKIIKRIDDAIIHTKSC